MQYQLKIQLQGISKPPVWRRVLVPGTFSLDRLHAVIQVAFGWENRHLYQFAEKGYRSDIYYGVPLDPDDPFFDSDMLDSRKMNCSEILIHEGQTYTYLYDFGDDWIHKIKVEKISDTKVDKAELLDGKSACPPEDCGGPYGYQELLEVLSDPRHPEYKEVRKWFGLQKDEVWDVNHVDVKEANKKVMKV